MLGSLWMWIVGSAAAILGIVRGVFMRKMRLGKMQSSALFDLVQKRGRAFVIGGEEVEDKMPVEWVALCWLSGMPFYLVITERMLRAGFAGTDSIVVVTMFRWQLKKLMRLISEAEEGNESEIPVYIMSPWDAEKVGALSLTENAIVPYLEDDDYIHIESDVQEVVEGERVKTGILLYGPPGNGKSYFVRYLALKYKMPIYIALLEKNTTNKDLVKMFGHIKGPCIVLFEDFDNYFDKRECKLSEASFTFDGILNVLDGVFSTPKQVVFFMTVNDINKIDSALKDRPSRFAHVQIIDKPGENMRRRIFSEFENVESLIKKTSRSNLDRVLTLRDRERAKTVRIVDNESTTKKERVA